MSKRLQQQRTQQIQDRNTLMNSMNNLINHIAISRKNQQEMFGNLTRKDFDKIVANFQDQLLKLRLTTVHLLTQLLYLNSNLKKKFCTMMDIWFCLDSNIVLNNNISKIIQKYPAKSAQIFILLKSYSKLSQWPIPSQSSRPLQPLFWFINPKKQNLTIEYLYREDISALIKSAPLNSNQNISGIIFDPIDCIFGINLSSAQQNYGTEFKGVMAQAINSETIKSRSNTKNNQPIHHREMTDSFTPKTIGYNQNYVLHSARNGSNANPNNSFLKQNNKQQPQIYVRQIPQAKKNNYVDIMSKTMIDERTPQSSIQTQYPNSSTSFQAQSYSNTASKKQNQGRLSLGDKEKYTNRLSLQMHELKGGQKKNLTTQGESILRPQISRRQPGQFQEQHHHGIQLITPRQSWKNSNQQKISIMNNGNQTDRLHTQKPISSRQVQEKVMNNSNQSIGNTQKLKTIHLGRGSKGWQTTRQKKNIKLQSH